MFFSLFFDSNKLVKNLYLDGKEWFRIDNFFNCVLDVMAHPPQFYISGEKEEEGQASVGLSCSIQSGMIGVSSVPVVGNGSVHSGF